MGVVQLVTWRAEHATLALPKMVRLAEHIEWAAPYRAFCASCVSKNDRAKLPAPTGG